MNLLYINSCIIIYLFLSELLLLRIMSIKNIEISKSLFEYLNTIVLGELVKKDASGKVVLDDVEVDGDITLLTGKKVIFGSSSDYITHNALASFDVMCGDEDMNITMNGNSIADTRTLTLSALNTGFGDADMIFNAKSNLAFKVNDDNKITCSSTSFEFFNNMNAGAPNTYTIGIHGNNWLNAYILTVNTNNISSIDTSALTILGVGGLNLNSTNSTVNVGTTGVQTINIGNASSTINIYGSFVYNPNTSLVPALDNTYDLGSNIKHWRNGYINNIYFATLSGESITGIDLSLSGTSSLDIESTGIIEIGADNVNQDIYIGTSGTRDIYLGSATGAVTINGALNYDFKADIIPETSNTYNLGSSSYYWNKGYITSIYNTNLTTANISSSTLDIQATGIIYIDSSGGVINIGDDANNYDIDIGTGGVRTITIGNASSHVYVPGFFDYVRKASILCNANNTYDIGDSTNQYKYLYVYSAQIGNLTNPSTLTINPTGDLGLESSGDINVGTNNVNKDINIATAGTRTIIIGNASSTLRIFGNIIRDYGDVIPATNNTYTLGSLSSNLFWLTGYITTVNTHYITNIAGSEVNITSNHGITINSTSQALNIGTDTNANDINIGTAGSRLINIGNAGSTTTIFGTNVILGDIVPDTNNTFDIGKSAFHWLNGYFTYLYPNNINGTDIDVQVTGNVTIDSSAGSVSIGNDNNTGDINIGTNGTRNINIGNTNANTIIYGTNLMAGDIVANVTDTYDLGTTLLYWKTGYITTIYSGEVKNHGITELKLSSTVGINMNSSGGDISIGNHVVNQPVNIGTGGVRTITIGNSNSTIYLYGTVTQDFHDVVSLTTNTYNLGSTSNYWLNGYITDVTTTNIYNIGATVLDIQSTNGIVMDSTAGTIGIGTENDDVDINIGTNGTRTITIGDATSTVLIVGVNEMGGSIIPTTTNTFDMGSASKYWFNNYLTNIYTSNVYNVGTSNLVVSVSKNISIDSSGGSITIGGNNNTGDISIGSAGTRNINLGNSNSTLTVYGTFVTSATIVPITTLTYDLGSASKYWNNGYVSTLYVSTISNTTLDIQMSSHITIDSSGGNISIGSDDDTGIINIGTNGARPINLGNTNSTLNVTGTINFGTIIPITNNTYNLGSPAKYWNNGYVTTLYSTNVDESGALNIGTVGTGTITFGKSGRTLNVESVINSNANIIPRTTTTYDLGTSSYYWNIGYITTVNSTTLNATTLNITNISGGAVDLQTTGAITIDSSGGTISIGSDNVNQNINIGTTGTRTLTLGNSSSVMNLASTISSNFVPTTTNTYDLGSATNYWNNSYITTMNTPKVTGTTLELTGTTLNITSTGTISVGDLASTTTINIGTTGAKTVNIGSASATVNISGFSFAVLNLVPETDNTYDLGSNAKKWKTEYVNTIYCDTYKSISNTMNIGTEGTVTEINIGTAGTTVNIPGFSYITGNIVPDTDGTRDLGSGTRYWANLYDNNISTLTIRGKSTSLDIDNANGTLDLGTNNYDKNINIGTSGTRVITIGSASATVNIIGLTFSYTNLNPAITDTYTLGTASYIWTSAYINTLYGNVIQPKAGATLDIYNTASALNIGTDVNNNAINIGTAGTKTITIGNTGGSIVSKINIIPNTTNTFDLGSATKYWNNGYITTINSSTVNANTISGGILTITATGNLDLESTGAVITIAGNESTQAINIATGGTNTITFGNATTTTTFNGTLNVATNLLPNATNTYNLGSSSKYWSNGYITTVNTGTISGTTLAISTTGAITVNSSGGTIGIGTTADDYDINVGTLGTRVITLGSATATISVLGTLDYHTSLIPNTNNAYDVGSGTKYWNVGYITTLNSSTANITTFNATTINGTAVDFSTSGAITINSSGSTIGIGTTAVNKDINIGTLGTRTITIGSANATVTVLGTTTHSSSIIPDITNTYDIGSSSKYWNVGYLTTVNTGTITGSTLSVSTTNNISVNSSGGTINVGTNNNDFNINVATAGTRTLTIGSATTTINMNGVINYLTSLLPDTTNTYNLGSASKYWNVGYITTLTTTSVTGTNIAVDGSGTLGIGTTGSGVITFGKNGRTLNVESVIDSNANIISRTNNTYDLGSLTKYWNNGYITTVNTVTVSGSTLGISATGVITMDSTGGVINIGTGANNFNINVATSGTRTLNIGTTTTTINMNGTLTYFTNLIPNATNTYDLGSSSKYWNNGYITTLTTTSVTGTNIAVDGSGTLDIGITGTGTITFGKATRTLNVESEININANILPRATTSFDLGGSSYYWSSGYINTVYTNNINGGAITVSGTGIFSLNSTGGTINIGTGANSYDISIGTAGTRNINIGTSTSTLVFGGFIHADLIPDGSHVHDLGSSSKYWNNGYITSLHSTGIDSTAGLAFTSVNAISLESSAGTIGLGNNNVNQNINIGTNGTRTITIGNTNATVTINGGFTISSFSNVIPALNNTYDLGSNLLYWNHGYITNLEAVNINGVAVSMSTSGAISINSSGGTISIGSNANNFAINIGTAGTRTITIGSANATLVFTSGSSFTYGNSLIPLTTDTYDLGSATKRWNNAYIKNISYVTLTSLSDRREKENIIESDLGLEFIMKLNPVKYKWKKEYNDDKTHYGFIAQDIEKVIKEFTDDVSMVEEVNEKKTYKPMELLAPMVKAIQELTKIVKELKEKLN